MGAAVKYDDTARRLDVILDKVAWVGGPAVAIVRVPLLLTEADE